MPRKKLESSAAEVAATSPESATAAKPVRKTTRKTAAAAPAKPKRTPQPKAVPVAAGVPMAAGAPSPDPVVEPGYDPAEQIARLAHAIYQARQDRGEEWGTPEGDWAYAEVLYREGVTNLE